MRAIKWLYYILAGLYIHDVDLCKDKTTGTLLFIARATFIIYTIVVTAIAVDVLF